MSPEFPKEARHSIQDLMQVKSEINYLVNENLGLRGIDICGDSLTMVVEDGMPDEFKEVLRGAADVKIDFIEIQEPARLDQGPVGIDS
jgi:hypothetical protein